MLAHSSEWVVTKLARVVRYVARAVVTKTSGIAETVATNITGKVTAL